MHEPIPVTDVPIRLETSSGGYFAGETLGRVILVGMVLFALAGGCGIISRWGYQEDERIDEEIRRELDGPQPALIYQQQK